MSTPASCRPLLRTLPPRHRRKLAAVEVGQPPAWPRHGVTGTATAGMRHGQRRGVLPGLARRQDHRPHEFMLSISVMPSSRQFPPRSFRASRSWDMCVGRLTSTDHLCKLTAVRCSIRRTRSQDRDGATTCGTGRAPTG
jgi:hypothetical protein